MTGCINVGHKNLGCNTDTKIDEDSNHARHLCQPRLGLVSVLLNASGEGTSEPVIHPSISREPFTAIPSTANREMG